MKTSHPPARLPATYLKIWEAVAEAGSRLGSRQALARHLHVSTHTLQRLLTRGDVPSFPETKNPRVVRAWIRTITRLAAGLGFEPREWVESVGIPWEETTKRVSESALRSPGSHRATGPPSPERRSPHQAPRDRGIVPLPGALTAAIVQCPALSTNLPEESGAFLLTYARRLVGALDPTVRIDAKPALEDQAVSELARRPAEHDLVLGIMDTVERRYRGLQILPIPGLRARLTALSVIRRGKQRRPTWEDVVSGELLRDDYIVVSENGVARQYLLGQCGVSAERLLLRSPTSPDRLAHVVVREAQVRSDSSILLVCREEIARLVRSALGRAEGFADVFEASELDGAPEKCPDYPVGIAVGSSVAQWLGYLRAAQHEALFANDYRRTARLYADLMASEVLVGSRIDVDDPGGVCRQGRIIHFDEATAAFQYDLCNRLVRNLSEGIRTRLEARGEMKVARGLRARADGLAVLYARRVIPDAWCQTLDAIFGQPAVPNGAGPPESPLRRHTPTPVLRCMSCSVSLLDEEHRGVSDRYCRFCADEQGHLKPRHEVQALIARWFQHWQSDLPEVEAMRRADLYMQALPAWSDN